MTSFINQTIARQYVTDLIGVAEHGGVVRSLRAARRAERAARREERAAGRRTHVAKPSNVALRGPGRINLA